jgi:hypothetical protein
MEVSVQRHALTALPPEISRNPLSEPHSRCGRVQKISPPPQTPPGLDPQIVQPVASRYTDYTNPRTVL